MFIQYISSYPPYLEAVFSIHNLRTSHAVVIGDPDNRRLGKTHNLCFSSSVNRIIESRRMSWVRNVACLGIKGMHIRFWWERQEEKDH
jgi:hypothetical protein